MSYHNIEGSDTDIDKWFYLYIGCININITHRNVLYIYIHQSTTIEFDIVSTYAQLYNAVLIYHCNCIGLYHTISSTSLTFTVDFIKLRDKM